MTAKIVTILIVGAVLAGSAGASIQATDTFSPPSPVSGGCTSRTESATSGASPVVVVVAPAGRFAASARGFTQRAPRIVLLTPRPNPEAD
jgi:hypothetical protein